jgi:hypothetical protein
MSTPTSSPQAQFCLTADVGGVAQAYGYRCPRALAAI